MLCCPVNICFHDMYCFKRSRILKKASDKFSDEMQVHNILDKIRTTHQMLKNFQINDQDKFIKYNNDYVIDENKLSSTDSDDGFDQDIGIGNENDNIGLDMQKAFSASILKDVNVDQELKKDLIDYTTMSRDTLDIKKALGDTLKRRSTIKA